MKRVDINIGSCMGLSAFLLASFILTFTGSARAEPFPTDITGTANQGETLEITGSGFGLKSPAAPLLWDDGENKTTDDNNAVTTESGYSQALPRSVNSSHNIAYRSIPFRGVDGPHNRSSQYLVGGHEEISDVCSGGKNGRDVMVTFTAPEPSKTWWASWYVRLDPLWPGCGDGANYKNWVVQTGSAGYTGSFNYSGYVSPNRECTGNDIAVGQPHRTVVYDGVSYGTSSNPFDIDRRGSLNQDTALCTSSSPCYGFHGNERNKWVRMGVTIAKNHVGVFGERAWDGLTNNWAYYMDDVPNYSFSDGSWDPASFTVGGYYREYWCNGTSGYFLNDNAYRYFDDIYIDNTLARVVLANNADFDEATIVEPQIPISWSDGSISVSVNLGKLPDSGAAFLFVFDADNNHNPSGYPVSIGGDVHGDDMPPSPPWISLG